MRKISCQLCRWGNRQIFFCSANANCLHDYFLALSLFLRCIKHHHESSVANICKMWETVRWTGLPLSCLLWLWSFFILLQLSFDVCSIYFFRFAYIVFPDKETAATVLSEKQGADLEGNALYLDYTGSKSSFKPRERSFNDSYGSRDGGDRRKSTGVCFVVTLHRNAWWERTPLSLTICILYRL